MCKRDLSPLLQPKINLSVMYEYCLAPPAPADLPDHVFDSNVLSFHRQLETCLPGTIGNCLNPGALDDW
jgi:hypothetical protein